MMILGVFCRFIYLYAVATCRHISSVTLYRLFSIRWWYRLRQIFALALSQQQKWIWFHVRCSNCFNFTFIEKSIGSYNVITTSGYSLCWFRKLDTNNAMAQLLNSEHWICVCFWPSFSIEFLIFTSSSSS